MDAIYYISGSLMTLTLIGLIVATIYFLIKPHDLQKSNHINKPISRSVIIIMALSSAFLTMLGYGSVMAATEPMSVKEARLTREAADSKAKETIEQKAQQDAKNSADQERKRQEQANKPVVKTETQVVAVPFESTEQQTSSLPKGQTKVVVDGVDGERTITYEVTYVKGKEATRREVNNKITKTPISKVTQVGTYVAAATPSVTTKPQPSSCDPNYSGQCVPIASDVDCGGGSGNGPAYVYGTVHVIGVDIYDLDRDGNGLGCE